MIRRPLEALVLQLELCSRANFVGWRCTAFWPEGLARESRRPLQESALRIAQVAPLHHSVPAPSGSAPEGVVSALTETLVEMGHDVTLFASGDSITSANLVAVVPKALNLDRNRPDPLVWHTIMIEMVLKSAASFDVIHFHTDVLQLA